MGISANNINLPFQGALLHPAVTPTYQGRGTGVPTDSCPGIGRWLGGTQGQPQATAPYAKYVVVGSKCSATWVPTSKSQQTAGVGVQTNICPYILSGRAEVDGQVVDELAQLCDRRVDSRR